MPVSGVGSGGFASGKVVWATTALASPLAAPATRQSPAFPQVEPAPANAYAIVNNSGTTVSHQGAGVYRVEKTGGTNAVFDADAVSNAGVSGDFVLRLKGLTATANVFVFGMNADPLTDSNYSGIDNAWGYLGGNSYQIYDINAGFGAILASSTYVWIWRVGSTVFWGRGADFATAAAAPDYTRTDSNTLYFDSSLYETGNTVEVYLYRPQASLAVAAGSYTISGTAVGLSRTRSLAAASGSYVLTGTATGLKAARRIAAAAGSYALTGSPVELAVARRLAAAAGSYAVTGTATALRAARNLAANAGTYSLTGTAAGLKKGYNLPATPGSYTIGGQSAVLVALRRLAASPGSYALSGTATGLMALRRLPAASGAYSISGQSVGLTYTPASSGYVLAAASGAYSIVGTGVGLRAIRRMIMASGVYALAGNELFFAHGSLFNPLPPSGELGFIISPSLPALAYNPATPAPAVSLAVSPSPAAGTLVQDNDPVTLEWSA